MLEIVIASRNRHKVHELKRLLAVRHARWCCLSDVGPVPAIRETGATFEANAIKKARAAAKATGRLALADDSGIEVDALKGAPGVRSARWTGSHGNDAANNAKLLRLLRGVKRPRRGAQYRCVLALASPVRVLAVAQGRWRGRIAAAPRGHRGFGYDPVFFLPRLSRTVGQLPAAVKQRISHRAIAARRMRRALTRLIGSTGSETRRAALRAARRRRARAA
ncbi:MAG: RdgB/HAM1 family non-canonical purine NTP pyrophosphatase [Candidatus Omnitrophica bacterium]|nr:RdgB/HAM1 family non-canonical purine NTP pyrophosphatase [Candidatus Omnitrophota bacterium]